MKRIQEPELMEEPDQVKAYAEADFAAPHNQFIEMIQKELGNDQFNGIALDLGCGAGDISCRFANAFPQSSVDAIDGSKVMLEFAESLLPPGLKNRVHFHLRRIPDMSMPRPKYGIMISNSLLHHLPEPCVLWETIKQYGKKGGKVFVMDLLRPSDISEAKSLVKQYSHKEPDILQRDFYYSLLASFSLDEIKEQLRDASLDFSVKQISDRHVFISGFL
jgi:ubiquinone/menaquinone biosynthesis C-methylase UbiE